MQFKGISGFRFRVFIDAGKKSGGEITDISLIDPPEAIRKEIGRYENAARIFTLKFIKTDGNGGLILTSSTKKLSRVWELNLERFETVPKDDSVSNPIYYLVLSVTHKPDHYRKLEQKYKELEKRNNQLIREIEKLGDILNRLEEIKESFRIPFDAIKDLMISFDCEGNVLVVNEASMAWFGQSPNEIAHKKCKTVFNQNIPEILEQVCKSRERLVLDENVGERAVQISYIPMTNKKNGKTEIVMLAQDITENRMSEEQMIIARRNQGVTVMGATIRHILNSSLTAILGFSQLALSTYDWPKETMVKYLRLIERTALRMKMEINRIAGQKEYRTVKYLEVPGTEECREIIEIEMDQES